MTKAANTSVVVPANYQPSDADTYMSPRMVEYFRLALVARKAEITAQMRGAVEFLQGERVNHPDPTDVATYNATRQLELRTKDRLRKLVRKIDQSLSRIEDGSYGYCVETGDEIGAKRLCARPMATLSIEAQELKERGERQHAG